MRNEFRSGEMKAMFELLAEKNIVLTGADAFTEKGFTMVPNAILRSRDLSMGAKAAYAALLSYAWNEGYCFPGQQRLADDIGVSRQTVSEYLRELSSKGFISVVRQGQGRPNEYELHVDRTGASRRRKS